MKRNLRLLGLLLCTFLGITSSWADTVTEEITLSGGSYKSDHIEWSGTSVTVQQLKGNVTTAVNNSYISAPRVYKGHILAFEAKSGYAINSIKLTYDGSYRGNSMTAGTAVNNNVVTDNTTDVDRTWATTSGGTHSISAKSTGGLPAIYIQNVASSTNTQLRLTKIEVEYTPPTTNACIEPTFSPAAGAVDEGTTVTITTATAGASIYYTMGENPADPTSGSTLYTAPIEITEATTIKAIAVKDGLDDSTVGSASYTIKTVAHGYTIDFENDLDQYADWSFTSVEKNTGDIDAHGGTYYGTTGGKTTASIQTKETIALPGTFTCYISKQTGNTTSSTWYVQVSTNGTNWTDVNSASATSMTKGAWTELSADLSAYSDVYVRLYYSGTSAVRNVDDISLTMRDPSAKPTPTVVIDASALLNDLAGETNVAAGTATATVKHGDTVVGNTVNWTSSNDAVATIDTNTGAVTLKAVGTTTLTASFAGNDDYTAASATYELTVVDTRAKGGENNPYTVAEAIAAYDAAGANITNAYIKGIVTSFYNNNSTPSSGALSYWISDDGETEQFEIYKGKYIGGVNFTDENKVAPGDVVVVKGTITKYNSTYETASGGVLISLQRPTVAVTGVTLDIPSVTLNPGETQQLTAIVAPANATNQNVSWVSDAPAVATVSAEGLVTAMAEGNATITVTTEDGSFTATCAVTVNTVAQHNVVFSVNGVASAPTLVYEGAAINFPDVEPVGAYKFQGWYDAEYENDTDAPVYVENAVMGTADVTYYAVFAKGEEETTDKEDELTYASVGVEGNNYKDWSDQAGSSSVAVYAGKTAGDNTSIQMRSNKSDSGIVSTTSGGKLKKVVVEWNSSTDSDRTLQIWGSNTAYTAPTQLYGNTAVGSSVGEIVNGSTEYTFTDDYKYIGLRSKSGAMYLDKITIIWETTVENYAYYCTTIPAEVAVGITDSAADDNGDAYATLYYSDKNLRLPSGVKAVTYKIEGGRLTESKTYADVIPAGEAVVLVGQPATLNKLEVVNGTYEKDAENQLLGTDTDETITAENGYYYYILSLNANEDDGSVGFYYPTADGQTYFTNEAHKAYLKVPAANVPQGVMGFAFGGGTVTRIDHITAGETLSADGSIYTLDGRKVSATSLSKGIYVKNGKKFIVK